MTDPVITIPEYARIGVNLASPRLGSRAVLASDEFFAAKERMLQDTEPVFIADKYDDNGKWMDGWESRRRRDGGNDWCLVRLGVAGFIHGVDIDTR
ncbi:MAG TPA: allantoicase, partial [Rhodospirillales bacterium]|nr:allantoicase [Rhodospirillales bacterium]